MAAIRSRPAGVVGGLLALVLLLAGCAGRPGVAAVVDGAPITEAYLAETVADFRPFSQVTPQQALQVLIVAPFVTEAAADLGVGASDDDARRLLEQIAGANEVVLPEGDFGPGILLIARMTVAQNEADAEGLAVQVQEAVQRAQLAADVEVNPRYGTWTPELGLGPVEMPWLLAPEVAF